MKRILFLVPRMNIGGAETYVYTATKELPENRATLYYKKNMIIKG